MRKRNMKIKSENPIIEIVDEDDDFLSLVAAAEAQALANKRRRITPSIPATDSKDNSDAEGIYLAALKGNDNLLQQSLGKVANARVKVVSSGNDNVYGGGGLGNACFKCSKLGHWSRDCGAEVGGGGDGDGGYNGNSYSSDQSIPEKSCPCGSGNCVVLTANTEKNRGRKFYKCPIRQENGGCGFFEWCDVSTGASVDAGGTQNYASNASYSDVPCPCGAGLCLILTAKTGNNIGRQFFRCPANQGSSCGFFKWCNELSTPGPGGIPATASKVTYNVSDPNNKVVRNGSSCFKCGKEGHWAKDCSIPTLNSPAQVGGRSSLSSSCFKCGKEGHWAKDCSIPTLNSPAQVGGRSSLSSAGYKCGKPGHWAKDCSF